MTNDLEGEKSDSAASSIGGARAFVDP